MSSNMFSNQYWGASFSRQLAEVQYLARSRTTKVPQMETTSPFLPVRKGCRVWSCAITFPEQRPKEVFVNLGLNFVLRSNGRLVTPGRHFADRVPCKRLEAGRR